MSNSEKEVAGKWPVPSSALHPDRSPTAGEEGSRLWGMRGSGGGGQGAREDQWRTRGAGGGYREQSGMIGAAGGTAVIMISLYSFLAISRGRERRRSGYQLEIYTREIVITADPRRTDHSRETGRLLLVCGSRRRNAGLEKSAWAPRLAVLILCKSSTSNHPPPQHNDYLGYPYVAIWAGMCLNFFLVCSE